MHEVDRAEFWELRYRQGETPWDLGGPTPAFGALLSGPDAPPPGSLLVPGCGRGHDAVLFARAGFQVTGVDYAPTALRAARELAARAGVPARFLEMDLFSLPQRFPDAFDFALEYTCFCAIDPGRREEYAEVLAAVLRPGGELLALFFPVLPPGYPPEGPPFAVSEEEITRTFGARFAVTHLAPTPLTIRSRRGRELLGRLRRR